MHRGSCLAVIALLALALTVSACGRRGQLERPAAAGVGASGQTTQPAPEKPDRPFILDGLLR